MENKMHSEKLKATFLNFIKSPGFTIRYFVEKTLRKLHLYHNAKLRLINLKLAKIIDFCFSITHWKNRINQCYFNLLYFVFLIVKKNFSTFIFIFKVFNKNPYTFFINLDHYFKIKLNESQFFFTQKYLQAAQVQYLSLKGFATNELETLKFQSVNKHKSQHKIIWHLNSQPLQLEQFAERILELMDHLKKLTPKEIHIQFIEDEPIHWDKLSIFLNNLKKEFDSLSTRIFFDLETNFTSPIEQLKKHHHLFDSIIANFNPLHSDSESFLKNLSFLQYRHPFICQITLEANSLLKTEQFIKHLEKFNFYQYHLLKSETLPDKNTESFFNKYKSGFGECFPLKKEKQVDLDLITDELGIDFKVFPSDFSSQKRYRFKGWTCHLHQCVVIDKKNNVFHGYCNAVDPVGNLLSNKPLSLIQTAIQCPCEQCPTFQDFLITKYRSTNQHRAYN